MDIGGTAWPGGAALEFQAKVWPEGETGHFYTHLYFVICSFLTGIPTFVNMRVPLSDQNFEFSYMIKLLYFLNNVCIEKIYSSKKLL